MAVLPLPQPNALNDDKGQSTQSDYRWRKSVGDTVNGLSSGKASVSQPWEQSFFIEYPEAKDYRVVVKASVARTITSVTTRCSTGTCTLTVKIDATALGGTANAVSTSEVTQAHSTNNAVAADQDVVFTVSAVSAPENMSVTLAGTLTLS